MDDDVVKRVSKDTRTVSIIDKHSKPCEENALIGQHAFYRGCEAKERMRNISGTEFFSGA